VTPHRIETCFAIVAFAAKYTPTVFDFCRVDGEDLGEQPLIGREHAQGSPAI